MPRKLKIPPKQAKKQNKVIQMRLMALSLKVDSYVYKGKPISAVEAAVYIDEIAAYKPQCSGDARCLQVIEKLHRCMKSVIAESKQEQESVDACETPQAALTCPSPVYSLPDEDRTLLTQNALEAEGQSNIVNHPSSTSSENSAKQNAGMEIIDLCDDDNHLEFGLCVDVEVHRALSNLSLMGTQESMIANVKDVECSQSILTGFEQNDTLYAPKNNSKEGNIQDLGTFLKNVKDKELEVFKKPSTKTTTTIQQKVSKVKEHVDIRKPQEEQVDNVLAISVEKTKIQQKESSMKPNIDSKIPGKQNLDKKVPEGSDNKVKRRRNGNKAKEENPKVDRTLQKIKKPRKKVTKARSESDKNEPQMNLNDATSNGISENKAMKIDSAASTNQNMAEFKTRDIDAARSRLSMDAANKQKPNAISRIYNRSVLDDLSWVENIRYVREVAKGEYDTALGELDDFFWDNLMLPPNFDDKDLTIYW